MIARSSHTLIGRNRIITLDFGAMYGGYASSFARVMISCYLIGKTGNEIFTTAHLEPIEL